MKREDAFRVLLRRGTRLYRTRSTEQAVANLDAVPPRGIPDLGPEGEEPRYTISRQSPRRCYTDVE